MRKAADPYGNFAAPLDWDHIRHALAVARAGSLAAAARELGVDETTVARRLRALEAALGTELFERHNGRLAPAAAGAALLERGQRIEREIAALRQFAADSETEVAGVIRVTAVDAVASHFLAPRIAGLRASHPALSVELIASSDTLDLSRREADIAIRLARPQRGDLVVRRLGQLAYAVYGADGTSADCGDWSQQRWVAYERSLVHVPEMRWLAGQVSEDAVVFRCNNTDALAASVADGIGLGILPCLVASRHPALRRLSGASPVLKREMWLATLRELRGVPRIRATCDWLVECFRAAAVLLAESP